MKRYLYTIALIIVWTSLNAQTQPWSLEKCIAYGIEHNIAVKRYELAKENQEITSETTRLSRLPDLSANVGQTFYFGRTPDRDGVYQDQTGSNSSLNVSTNLNLFSGFQVTNQIKADRLDLNAAVEDLNKAREDVSLAITGYYLQMLLAKELYKIALDQLELNKEQVVQTEALVKGGKSSESELYDAQAAMAQQQMSVTEAANNLDLSRLSLTQALNLQELEDFDIEVPDMAETILKEKSRLCLPADVYARSVMERPVIRAAEFRVGSSRKTLQIAKGAYYPSLRLGAGYSNFIIIIIRWLRTGNASLADQWAQNGAESVGLSLSIPIFNRMTTRNRVRSAQLNIKNQELLLDQAKQDLYKEVQQAYYNATAAHDKYLSSETAVEAAQLAFNFEKQKYNAGRSNTYAFNQVRLRLASALSESAQAKYNFLFRTKILAFYNGAALTDLP